MMWVKTQNGSLLNLAQVTRIYIDHQGAYVARDPDEGVSLREYWNVVAMTNNGGTVTIAGRILSQQLAQDALVAIWNIFQPVEIGHVFLPAAQDIRVREDAKA